MMARALNAVRAAAVELLERYGVPAVAGMEPAARVRQSGPVAAVSLSRVVCAAGGFQDYLGVKDGDELYGRAVELTLSLDLYAPRDGGESACQTAFAALAEALTCGDLAGLTVTEISGGQLRRDPRRRRYRGRGEHPACAGDLHRHPGRELRGVRHGSRAESGGPAAAPRGV